MNSLMHFRSSATEVSFRYRKIVEFPGRLKMRNCPGFNQKHPAKWGIQCSVFYPGNYLMKMEAVSHCLVSGFRLRACLG